MRSRSDFIDVDFTETTNKTLIEFEKPIATGVRLMPADSAAAIDITHADGSKRLAFYESGSGPGGLRLKGRFAVIEFDPRNRLRSLLLVHGTELSHGGLQLQADRAVSLSVTIDANGAQLVSAPRLGYETVEGQAVYGSGRQGTVSITVPEQWSPTGKAIRKRVLIPGQTKAGPSPVDVQW